ncbi:hypothetical protein SLS58_000945 [Diplodia intermedia]|uniref:Uncharacterized protein n=1 Tax=Diplodia intermedia TaxID=856260 RepID=A0ABR3U3F0_9PEZI
MTDTITIYQQPHQIQLRAPSPPPPKSSPPSSSPSSSLLDRLPTELRLQIYDHLFPNKPIPATATAGGASTPRHDGDPSTAAAATTKLLRLNRAIHAEASAVLYARAPFEVRVHPGGVALAGGRALTYGEFDFGKRGGPAGKVHRVVGGGGACCDGVLGRARRLDVKVVAWVQHGVFERVCGYVRHLVERLVEAQGVGEEGLVVLTDLRVAVEWHNGTTNFPVTHPTPQMARRLLEPFRQIRVTRNLDVGNVGTPRYFFGAPALAAVEEEQYRVLKEELKDTMMLRFEMRGVPEILG